MATPDPHPLAGKRIVVTRAASQTGDLARALEALGAEVLFLPSVSFAPPQDSAPLDRALRALGDFDWVLFTSQNAVRFFCERRRALGLDGTWPERAQIAAVGPATAQTAQAEGLRVNYVAREHRGEALVRELPPNWGGKRVLLPRSDRAGSELPETLARLGAQVADVIAYTTAAPEEFDPSVLEAVRRGDADVITFLSPSAFHHLLEEVGAETFRRQGSRMLLAAIGPTTARAIEDSGLRAAIIPHEATAAALAAAIAAHFRQLAPSEVRQS